MKVPLILSASRKGVTVTYQKKVEKLDMPFEPYIIVSKEGMKDAQFEATNYSTGKRVPCKRLPVSEDIEVGDLIYELRTKGYGIESNPYLEQIFIDEPDFVNSYPNGEPDVLCFDIETYTDGTGVFPHHDRSPIISIAAKYNNEKPVIFADFRRTHDFPDKKIIQEFLMYMKMMDPDIIVTYNGKSFDLPYLVQRAMKCGIDLKKYSRTRMDWYWKSTYKIPGHIHYDLYRVDVAKAQDLMGIKNRKMKTVAKWFEFDKKFGITIHELGKDELSNTSALIGTDRLLEYNVSDVEISKRLYDNYRLNHEMMAEFLNVSLEQAINAYPSFPPKIILGRAMKSMGYVFLDSNEARHPGLAGKYEGGYVSILKKGLIPKVWKLDVAGFYPSVMIAFNISPETTKIENVAEYTGEWKFSIDKGIFKFQIPDAKLKKDIIISIDRNKEGTLSKMLADMKATRLALKEESKTASGSDKAMLKARSDALKVTMNSVYGSAALPETVYSDLSVALATIAICRYLFRNVVEKFKDIIIEADSVEGDTPVFVRTKNDHKHGMVQISTLWEFPGEEIADGEVLRKNLSMPMEILTATGWEDLVSVYKHRTNKTMYRVMNKEFLVDVTEDHSLIAEDGTHLTPTQINRPLKFTDLPVLPQKDHVIASDYAEALATILRNEQIQTVEAETLIGTEKKPGTYRSLFKKFHLNPDAPEVMSRLRKLCLDGDQIKVPQALFEAKKEIVRSFLRKYKDDKGEYVTTSKLFAAGLMLLLNKVEKVHRMYIENNNGVTTYRLKEFDEPLKINKLTIERLPEMERDVYDVTTASGTFTNLLGFNELKNTDGIYVDSPIDSKEVQDYIRSLVEGMIGKTEKSIDIDRDVFGPGWFHRSKNYVLFDPDKGTPIFHGVAFKASSHSPIYDSIMNTIALMVFSGKSTDEIWTQVKPMLDLKKYSLPDFILRTSIKGDEIHYANANSLQARLIQQAKKLGISVEPGTQMEYIVCKGRNYQLASLVTDVKEVDHTYYENDLNKAMELFGLGDIQQLSLL